MPRVACPLGHRPPLQRELHHGDIGLFASHCGPRAWSLAAPPHTRPAACRLPCVVQGHVGVGSVVGLSNARVARELGLEIVLVANGGLGSTFDELELNRTVRSGAYLTDAGR